MRLVRVGGRYLGGREQRLWMALASLLGLATAGILVAVETPGGRPLYLGAGMVAVLTALRQEMARPLLRDGRLAVSEVAFLLGYRDPSAFQRAFRAWHGLSPRAFRQAPQ